MDNFINDSLQAERLTNPNSFRNQLRNELNEERQYIHKELKLLSDLVTPHNAGMDVVRELFKI